MWQHESIASRSTHALSSYQELVQLGAVSDSLSQGLLVHAGCSKWNSSNAGILQKASILIVYSSLKKVH